MATTTSKRTTKRPSKGQRTYTRRLKQAARKEIGANTPQPAKVQPVQEPKPKDQS